MGHTSARHRILEPRYWIEAALDLLFPPQCIGCATPGFVWCPSCTADLRVLGDPLCVMCGLPVKDGARVCPGCSHSPPILRSRSFAWYRSPLDTAVLHLKYRPDRRLADVMGGWLAGVCRKAGWRADMIAAVPLSPSRLKQRGYNQAVLLAASLGRRLDLPLRERALSRTRETGTQVGLGPEERRQNVADAFVALKPVVQEQAVIVVDDLYTTGATLEACASSLLDSGASRVYGVTVARAGHIDPGAKSHGGQYNYESPDQRPSVRAHGSDARLRDQEGQQA